MKEMSVLVSAILPIYNVDQYLRAAVESLVHQSYKNIEIILVNDGSTDDSAQVAEELQQQYSNVKLIDQPNAGAAEARNSGMRVASGKYYYFMDPDDVMKSDYIASMVHIAEKAGTDLVIAGFTNVYQTEHGNATTFVSSSTHSYASQAEFRKDAVRLLNNTQLAVPWNKLYRADYLTENNLQFPRVKWDDLHFNLEVIRNITKVALVDNTGYQFLRVRPGSETTTVFNDSLFKNRKSQFEHVIDVFEGWKLNDQETDGRLAYYFVARVFQVIQQICDNSEWSRRDKNNKIEEIVNDNMVVRQAEICKLENFPMKIVLTPVIRRNVSQCRIMGELVSFIQSRFASIFRRIRVTIMRVAQ